MSTSTLERSQLTYGEMRTKEEKKYDKEVMRRVKAGMALLEKEYGPDWVEQIDLETLALSDTTSCVLGQVYGSYGRGLSKLRVSPFTHGFDVYCSELYGPLTAAWRDAIRSRVVQ